MPPTTPTTLTRRGGLRLTPTRSATQDPYDQPDLVLVRIAERQREHAHLQALQENTRAQRQVAAALREVAAWRSGAASRTARRLHAA